MALFNGSGTFTQSGGKTHDIEFATSGLVTLSSDARGLDSQSDLTISGGSLVDSDISGDLLISGNGVNVENVRCDDIEISGNDCLVHIDASSLVSVLVSGDDNRVRGRVDLATQHGVSVSGDDNDIEMVVRESGGAATNTYDNIHITGNRNFVTRCALTPRSSGNTTRYGLNIASGTANVVFGNFLGDSSAYGSADSVDNGTDTITAADDGVIGGQFAY